MAQHHVCVLLLLLGLTGVQALTTYYMVNHCGNTVFVSFDEQVRVFLTSNSTYNNRVNCNVTFQTSPGKEMKIDVTYIATESCCDWIAMHDGHSVNTSTLLGRLRGNVAFNNTSMFTSTNILTAKFVSDDSVVRRGFEVIITPYHTGQCTSSEHMCSSSGRCVSQHALEGICDPCLDNYWNCGTPVRLVDGDNPLSGRLEIYTTSSWETVCYNHFTTNNARVVCRMLGYSSSTTLPKLYTSSMNGHGTGNISDLVWTCNRNNNDLSTCNKRQRYSYELCNHTEELGIDCGNTIRLVNGPTRYEGRLEIFYAGHWGTVCDDSFGNNDARVVCRILGYDWDLHNVMVHSSAYYGSGSGSILLDDLKCAGHETQIDQCNHSPWLVNNCGHSEDVGVNCGLPVRLVDGNSSTSGRLEVYTNSSWNTVCYRYFTTHNAQAVCSLLGTGRIILPKTYDSSVYGPGVGNISELIWSCNVYNDDLYKCSKRQRYSYEQCHHSDDVGIDCGPPYRLVKGTRPNKGVLEIFNGTNWETMCSKRFHTADARVVCRALGYSQYDNVSTSHVSTYQSAINDQMWSCNGNERNLEECYHYDDQSYSCNHYNDVFLECGTDIRLMNGSHRGAGRIEIYHDGQWGTICDDDINKHSAMVICNMLGYNDTALAVPYSMAHYGPGTGPIMIDGFSCTGRETSIVDCMRGSWYKNDCHHVEDAGVDCIPIVVRLVGGTQSSNGRLEVYYQGQWGTVCDDSFDSDDARVVCKMLGFTSYRYPIYHPAAYYGAGNGSIIVDELNCNGNEASIENCTSNPWLSHDCSHSEDVGVDCNQQTTSVSPTFRSTTHLTTRGTTTPRYSNVRIRLVNGTGPSNGRLEVYYRGQWGTVCDDSFGSTDARVVCRMLGYNYYTHPMFHPQAYYGEGYGNITIDDLNCSGYETSIVNCASSPWLTHNCGHNEDVGVDCYRNYYETGTTTTSPYVTTQSYLRLEDAIRAGCNEYGWDIRIDMNMLRTMYPNIRASDIYLGKNLCTGLDYGSSLLFHQGLRECLTSETISGTELIYKNELVYAIHDANNPFIIRRYNWTVEVECDVSRNQTATGHLHHDAHNGTTHHVSGSSNYTVQLSFYQDPNFRTPLTGNPFHVAVGTKVYVKVYTTANDWNVKMVVHDCYTKPSPSSPDHTKYAIITNGCEVDTNTHLISQSTHETKFVFEDFEYTTNHEGIYLFCDATFCGSSDYSRHCQQMCH